MKPFQDSVNLGIPTAQQKSHSLLLVLWTEARSKRISTLPLFLQQPSNCTSLHLYTPLYAHTTCSKECNTHLDIKLQKHFIRCSLGHSPLIISGTSDWKTTQNNNYALELDQGAGPSALASTGAANLSCTMSAGKSGDRSQLAAWCESHSESHFPPWQGPQNWYNNSSSSCGLKLFVLSCCKTRDGAFGVWP